MMNCFDNRVASNAAWMSVDSPRPGMSRQRMRGATAVARLGVIALVIVLAAAAAWWYLGRSGAPLAPKVIGPTAGESSAQDVLPAVVASEDVSVGELYKQARAAMKDNRMVSPEGSNALEYYLRILAVQPDDANAKDALRELFPFATGSAEDQINQGNFDDANRIITLLGTADPSNYALTILRSKLDARKRQGERELAQQAQKEAAALAAAARNTASGTTASAAAEAGSTPETAPAGAPNPTEVASAAPIPVVTPPPAPRAAPAPEPVAPVGETREARVVVPPNPSYPAAAVRNRQNGWVEVQFTVEADGSVKAAKVTGSEPRGVFDREAVAAVQKAKFEARLEKGVPVASTLRRRIEFKLN